MLGTQLVLHQHKDAPAKVINVTVLHQHSIKTTR